MNSIKDNVTLRDYFAGIALPILMQRAYDIEDEGCCGDSNVHALLRIHTKEAYRWADAMLEAKTR